MKLAIVTLPLHTNYGGILQAYALQTILTRLGHQVEMLQIERPRKLSYRRMPLVYVKRFVKKFILRRPGIYLLEEQWWNQKGVSAIREYLNKYLHLRLLHSIKELNMTDYDGYIVGSDQVWRKPYFCYSMCTSICDAFLDFAKKWPVKRIVYAASFGTDTWEYTDEETLQCRSLSQLFDVITVREASAVELCKQKLMLDATHVLDPTMLLTADDYQKLFERSKTPKSEGNMFCYILDLGPKKQELIDNIVCERGLKPFYIKSIGSQVKENAELVQSPIEQWLRAFYDSEFVVTDSFHGCVFCILFRKQFVVYGNAFRGMARFNSLLSVFGLEERLVIGYEKYKELSPIDYTVVYSKLDVWRARSLKILQSIE